MLALILESELLPLSLKELVEGACVSLAFVAIPVIAHAEHRHKRLVRMHERHHAEQMAAHRAVHDHLGIPHQQGEGSA